MMTKIIRPGLFLAVLDVLVLGCGLVDDARAPQADVLEWAFRAIEFCPGPPTPGFKKAD